MVGGPWRRAGGSRAGQRPAAWGEGGVLGDELMRGEGSV
jgi:hypothetical protein